MNASIIILFFHKIDLSTTTGIKTFNNAIIGLDDNEKYYGIQDRITNIFKPVNIREKSMVYQTTLQYLRQPTEFISHYITILA